MKVGDQEEQKAPPEPGVVMPYHQDLEKAHPPSLKNGLGRCCAASEQMLILACSHPSCFTSSLCCKCLLVQPSKHTCRFCPPLTPAVYPCRFSSGSNRWPPSVPPSVLHSHSERVALHRIDLPVSVPDHRSVRPRRRQGTHHHLTNAYSAPGPQQAPNVQQQLQQLTESTTCRTLT